MADDLENSSDSGEKFRINTAYAERYNTWRRKEEVQKLQDRYGDEDESSSTSEEEDEDAEALTPQVEKAWLRAYAAVKSKDPKIYQSINFFNSSDEDSESDSDQEGEKKKKGSEKPVYLKDYERKIITERGGKLPEESEDEDNGEMITPGPSYFEEQDEIKKSIQDVVGSESESEDDLLQKRRKTKEEEVKEESDYLQWLKGQKNTLEDKEVGVELDSLRNYWSDPKLEPGEKFLRDYILNKRYIDKDNFERIPTYAEIVDEEDLSDDEKTLDKQETFERKFNFRFEEPDTEYIKSYPRTIQDTVRRQDDKRKIKRAEVKERKGQEKEKKQEDLKQLKNMKKKEILEKLQQLKEATGNPTVGFNEDDIEGDFDPAEYDRKMQAVFNEEYYDEAADGEKPVFDNDEELGLEDDNWDNWEYGAEEGYEAGGDDEAGEENEPHCDDEDFNMDCDYDPNQPKKSKKERKSKVAQAVAAKKPQFDPGDKTFEQYFDEYYKLDYEDIIDDLPCRFKYRQVAANDFGLSTSEVFKCRDKELNAWASLKKMSQYRTEEEEQHEFSVYRMKARNERKKHNLLPSLKEEERGRKITNEGSDGQNLNSGNKKKRKLDQETLKEGSNKGPKQNTPPKKKVKVETVSKAPDDEDSHEQSLGEQNSLFGSSENVKSGQKVAEDKFSGMIRPDSNKSVEETDQDPNSVPETLIVAKTGETASQKRRKRRKRRKAAAGGQGHGEGEGQHTVGQSGDQEEKTLVQNDKGKSNNQKVKKPVVSDDRLKAYGINPKKFKYMDLQRAPKFKQKS